MSEALACQCRRALLFAGWVPSTRPAGNAMTHLKGGVEAFTDSTKGR